MKEAIEAYLQNPIDYQKGLSLYIEHGKNEALKTFFRMGESSLTKPKLITSLKELLQTTFSNTFETTKADKVAIIAAKKAKEIKNISPSDLPTAPIEIQQFVKRRISLYKERASLFSQLKLMVDNELKFNDGQRGEIATKILKMGIEIESLWKLTNYYDATLLVPKKPSKTIYEINSDIELMKQLNATRVKISRAETGKRKIDDIEELKAQRDFLEKLIEEREVDVTIKN